MSDALHVDLDAARRRIAASAEAVSYRTDIKNRAKDAVEQGKENLLAMIAQSFDSAKSNVQKAASIAQDKATDLGGRLGENLAPVVETVRDVAESAVVTAQHVADATSDVIESRRV